MNKKELFLISIGIFLTVIAWLIGDLYHASTQEKIKTKVSLPQVQKYEIRKDILLLIKEKSP